jgi:hypothetical protein
MASFGGLYDICVGLALDIGTCGNVTSVDRLRSQEMVMSDVK